MGGAPRTDKTTIARQLAERVEGVHVRSDAVRRDIGGSLRPPRREHDPLDRGIYSPDVTALTYTALTYRARMLLCAGYSVILDAAFPSVFSRREVGRLARACRADFVAIECRAPLSVLIRRARGHRRADDLSEATPEVAAALQARRSPWPAAHSVDTTAAHAVLIAQCLTIINETPIEL